MIEIEKGFNFRQAQLLMKNRQRAAKKQKEIARLENKIETTEKTNLQDIKGIGPATIQTLLENGIKSKEDLESTGLEKVKEIIKSPISLKAIKNIFNKKK